MTKARSRKRVAGAPSTARVTGRTPLPRLGRGRGPTLRDLTRDAGHRTRPSLSSILDQVIDSERVQQVLESAALDRQ